MKKILAIGLFLTFIVSHANPVITGKVTRIIDGDTIELIHTINCMEIDCEQVKKIKIRLAEIDAPESSQPYGYAAKQMLADMIFNKEAKVEIISTDRYGRAIGQIWTGHLWINGEMVKNGGAWVYPKYLEHAILLNYQEQAQAHKLGIWSLQEDQIMPPWLWRKVK